jgi:hypothetical protein
LAGFFLRQFVQFAPQRPIPGSAIKINAF